MHGDGKQAEGIPRKERVFQRDPDLPLPEDIRERVFELEEEGEWIVQRVPEPYVCLLYTSDAADE